ncbi:MAG TPA: hypothetical protein VM366_01785 [Anaerolineae bacterium]|nr:hypothetical protein [Anaerolineae bacterium]
MTQGSGAKSSRDGRFEAAWPRAFYAAYLPGAVSQSPFLVLRYQALGLSGRQIGALAD